MCLITAKLAEAFFPHQAFVVAERHVHHPVRTGLDAPVVPDGAVIRVHRLMAADFGILEPVGPLLGHEQVHVLAQAALIAPGSSPGQALQGQDVVGLLIDDLSRDPRVKPVDMPRAGSPSRRW